MATPSPFVTVRPAAAKAPVRLVCFPHSGAGDWVFYPWARFLPDWIEILACRGPAAPGEPVEAQAARAADGLAAAAGPAPVLFGHSLGALVAYEAARRLRERACPPAGLFVSGCGGPPDPLRLAPAALDDPRALVGFLESLGGTPPEFLALPELCDPLLAAAAAGLRAARAYRHAPGAPLGCPLAAAAGTADETCGRREGLDAWSRETTGAFGLTMFPGPHNYWLGDPRDLLATLVEFLGNLPGRPVEPGPWGKAPDRPDPGDGVHLWRGRLDLPPGTVARLAEGLDPAECERAARFRFEVDRRRFVVAHAMLRGVLARYLGCEAGQVRLRTSPAGRPELPEPGGPEFSLSHSGGLALVGLARRPLGVDLEDERPLEVPGEVVARYFSAPERDALARAPGREGRRLFLQCWTHREAYGKARGTGLGSDLGGLSLDFGPAGPTPVLRDAAPGTWSFFPIPPTPGYAGTCAVLGPGGPVEAFDWSPDPGPGPA